MSRLTSVRLLPAVVFFTVASFGCGEGKFNAEMKDGKVKVEGSYSTPIPTPYASNSSAPTYSAPAPPPSYGSNPMNANNLNLMNANVMPDVAESESAPVINNTRVRFGRGETSADYDGMIEVGETNAYTMKARAGQTMTVILDGIARADVYQPDNEVLDGGVTEEPFVLTQSGNYVIAVSDVGQRGRYTISFIIE